MKPNHVHLYFIATIFFTLAACMPIVKNSFSVATNERAEKNIHEVLSIVEYKVYENPNGAILPHHKTASPAFILSEEKIDSKIWLKILMPNNHTAWIEQKENSTLAVDISLKNKQADATNYARKDEAKSDFKWIELNKKHKNIDKNIHYMITGQSHEHYIVSPAYIADRGRQIQHRDNVWKHPSSQTQKTFRIPRIPDIKITTQTLSGWLTFKDLSFNFSADTDAFSGLINPPFLDAAKKTFASSRLGTRAYISIDTLEKSSDFLLSQTHYLQQMLVVGKKNTLSHINFWAKKMEDDYVFDVHWDSGDAMSFGIRSPHNSIATPYIVGYEQQDFDEDGFVDIALYCLMVSGDEETMKRIVINSAAKSLSTLLL